MGGSAEITVKQTGKFYLKKEWLNKLGINKSKRINKFKVRFIYQLSQTYNKQIAEEQKHFKIFFLVLPRK